MVALNNNGEVADLLNIDQFIPGRSAYECVAYSAALCKYAGQPGHGAQGSTLIASNLAQYWYGREEGSNAASNTNGMSLEQEYAMLSGMSLSYYPLPITGDNTHDLACVRSWLALGYPVMICGAETGFYDIGIGDHVPYSWTPSGNHCIVASGVASGGNLFVHDCANIAPNGIRPAPRTYDASKMHLVSATAVQMAWLPVQASGFDPLEDNMSIDINSPGVGNFFEETDAQHWKCKSNGNIIQFGILAFYCRNNGLLTFGLPLSPEVTLDAQGNTKQYFERGCLVYDPQKKYDNPPGSGNVYTAHVYADNALGEDPLIPKLEATITQLQAQPATDQAIVDKFTQIKQIVNA